MSYIETTNARDGSEYGERKLLIPIHQIAKVQDDGPRYTIVYLVDGSRHLVDMSYSDVRALFVQRS